METCEKHRGKKGVINCFGKALTIHIKYAMAAILGVRPLRERNFKGRALRGKSKGSF
jgi:hypothetical protein